MCKGIIRVLLTLWDEGERHNQDVDGHPPSCSVANRLLMKEEQPPGIGGA